MTIRPKLTYKLHGTTIVLDPESVYEATPATNQPNWEARGAVFVNEVLLERDDYVVLQPGQVVVARNPDPRNPRDVGILNHPHWRTVDGDGSTVRVYETRQEAEQSLENP